MRQSKEVINSWIERVNDEGRNLTEWELGFMENITEQFERTRSLTENQESKLEDIYTNKTR